MDCIDIQDAITILPRETLAAGNADDVTGRAK